MEETIEIVLRKIENSGRVTETVLASFESKNIKNKSTEIFSFPNLEIHVRKQIVYHNGVNIPMSHYEFYTLTLLAQHPGWVFSKEQIYEAVWKENPKHCGSAVANVISQIRRKIGEGYIETVINSGYKFIG